MKKLAKTAFVIALTIVLAAFTNPIKEKKEVKESTINWVGKKITGSHEGTIDLKEGYIEMEGDKIVGAKFIVDMSTIVVTDLKGKSKGNLEAHLNSDDFFGTADHPTATLLINRVEKMDGMHKMSGEITVKGVTEPLSINVEQEENTFKTTFKIDRTKFGIRYGSGSFFDNLGDKTINDDFTLTVSFKI